MNLIGFEFKKQNISQHNFNFKYLNNYNSKNRVVNEPSPWWRKHS